jgi:glycosyltransferase involved in cell wall biosynthesis
VSPNKRAIICFPFSGGLVGGSHLSALKLIETLDRTQFKPLVLLHQDEGPLAELLRAEGLEPEVAPMPWFLRPGSTLSPAIVWNGARHIRRAAAFLRDRGVRIVHTNEGPMHATWSLPARLAGAKHVWHHRGNPRAAGLRYLAPILANRVVSVSRFAAPAPGLLSARRKCSIVSSPFDTTLVNTDREAARATVLAAIGASPDTRILLFLGHFADRKRPVMFVDMISALRDLLPNLPIVGLMFGEDFEPGQKALVEQRISERGVAGTVRLMGFRRPIETWLAGSDLLIVPAVEEPFGRTLIEAMLLGTPVIAAASGGNIEAIRDLETGILVAPDQALAFARQAGDLLLDPLRARNIAARAQAEAEMKFGIERHASAIAAIYREVLAQ